MLFNSYIFIFLFLPLCLAGFYILQNRQATLAKVWLTCFSLWFYGYFNTYYLAIMVCSILGNYLLYRLLRETANENKEDVKCKFNNETCAKRKKHILITGVIINLLVLFYFKYFDFFLENINAVFAGSLPLKNILLPLGISFFTFQQISFLADTYRGEVKQCGFVDYALFVSFFPQLIAGPIVTQEEMLPQFARIGNDGRSREEKTELFVKGIYMFVLGLAKKVLIADTFGIAVDYAYGNVAALNGLESLITILFYSLQLYFDFSGYCDMAKGIGGMFGIRITNNFDSPYKAADIVDFWKRWHITLSRFFTQNIYIPLGGNRRGAGRMYLNYLIVFFLSGLWHGAGWNFILWGMLHGVLYTVTKWWTNNKRTHVIKNTKVKKVLKQGLTFAYVSFAWVYFRAATVGEANLLFQNIALKPWALPGSSMLDAFNLGEFWYVLKVLKVTALPYSECYLMVLFTAVTLGITFLGKNAEELTAKFKPGVWNAVLTAVCFVWCVISLSGVSTFLYFNF